MHGTARPGAGRIRVDNQPADTDNCHTASNKTGNAQGARLWMIFFMANYGALATAVGGVQITSLMLKGLGISLSW